MPAATFPNWPPPGRIRGWPFPLMARLEALRQDNREVMRELQVSPQAPLLQIGLATPQRQPQWRTFRWAKSSGLA